jgi:hypothetical protein
MLFQVQSDWPLINLIENAPVDTVSCETYKEARIVSRNVIPTNFKDKTVMLTKFCIQRYQIGPQSKGNTVLPCRGRIRGVGNESNIGTTQAYDIVIVGNA